MFCELICGLPGSGKTTYCEGRRQFLSLRDDRRVGIINLDPANEGVFPYPCDINVTDLVDHAVVMEREKLGPNGSYLFCIDFLGDNAAWLVEQIRRLDAATGGPTARPLWLLIDCPGQVEYYLQSEGMAKVVRALQKAPGLRCNVCAVHLCDAAVATRDISTYVSTCLLSLSTMTDLELPHVNVLSKWDTVSPAAAMARAEQSGDNHAGCRKPGSSRGTVSGDGAARSRAAAAAARELSAEEVAEEDRLQSFLDTTSFRDNFSFLWRRQVLGRARENDVSRSDAEARRGNASAAAVANTASDAAPNYADDPRYRLADRILEVVDGYNLLGFIPLDVMSGDLMAELGEQIDASVGWCGMD